MKIGESKKRYLEAINSLLKTQDVVIAVDIARYLNYSKPSVSCAIKQLEKMQYINIGVHNIITLTDKGQELALNLNERKIFFQELLLRIGLEKSIAEEDAIKLTHSISDEGYLKLQEAVIEL